MKIQVPVVVEMTDEQVAMYAAGYGLPRSGGRLYAREVVEDVQAHVLNLVQESAAFAGDGATVSIKGR